MFPCCQALDPPRLRVRSRLLAASSHDTSFHDSAFLPPKACRLETGHKSPFAPPFSALDVKGDGRCGYRALAAYLGISWSQVMQRLLGLMVAAPGLFTVAEVFDFMSATDPQNACSRAAWLSNRHISLLCEVDAWFPQGIAVHKFQTTPDFIHFECRGKVRTVSEIPRRGVCLLGLVTQGMSHFVLLQTPSPQGCISAPGTDGDDVELCGVSGGAGDESVLQADCQVPRRHFYDTPLCLEADVYFDNVALPPQEHVVFHVSWMVSGACLGSHSVPSSELVNRQLHVVVIKLVAAMLDASPFGLRVFLSAEAVSGSSVGLRLAPTVHVRALRMPKRFDLANELLEAIDAADVDGVVRLLSEGQCPNQPGEGGLLPLYAALNRKNVVASSVLIQARANLDERFDFGGTALHLACRQDLPTVIGRLLQARADVHAPDNEGDSPLHVAAACGTVTSVRLLLAASAHVGAANLRLETALTTAADTGAQPGVVAVLMQADWPDAWCTMFLMNLSILCRTLGTARFPLFRVCRALSYQREFYPLLRAEVAGGSHIDGKCASPAGSPLLMCDRAYRLTCDTALQCHILQFASSLLDVREMREHLRAHLRLPLSHVLSFQASSCALSLADIAPQELTEASHIHGGSTMPEAASNHPDDYGDASRTLQCPGLFDEDTFLVIARFFAPLPSALRLCLLSRTFLHILQQERFLRLMSVAPLQLCSWHGPCALHSACEHGLTNLVSRLLDANACITCRCIDGLSPLETALVCEQAETATLLLRHEASLGIVDFNAKNRHGDSIITLAANMHHPARSELTSLVMTQQWPRSTFDALLMILQRLEAFGSMSSPFFSSCRALRGQRPYYALCGTFSGGSNFRFQGGSTSGCTWDTLPKTCQVLIVQFFASLPDLLVFLSSDRRAVLLLASAAANAGLLASIKVCRCNRLCLNQALAAMTAQGFPIQKQVLLYPRTFPSIHRGWEWFQSIDKRYTVWMAQRLSPCVSTVVISLSGFLQRQHHLQISLGFSTADTPSAIAWPDLFRFATSFQHRELKITLIDGVSTAIEVRTEATTSHTRRPTASRDFTQPHCFTVISAPTTFAAFGSNGNAIIRCTDMSLWDSVAASNAKAFVCLHARDALRNPMQDPETNIQPTVTRIVQGKAIQRMLRTDAPHEIRLFPFSAGATGESPHVQSRHITSSTTFKCQQPFCRAASASISDWCKSRLVCACPQKPASRLPATSSRNPILSGGCLSLLGCDLHIQSYILQYASALHDVLRLSQTCHHLRVLLAEGNAVRSLCFNLQECSCEHFCTNKALVTMLERQLPSAHLRTDPVSLLLAAHPTSLNSYYSLSNRRGVRARLWTSSPLSNHFFSVRIALSLTFSSLRNVALCIGLGVPVSIPALHRSTTELRHRCGINLTLHCGQCDQVQWVTHAGTLRSTHIQPLNFSQPLFFTFRMSDRCLELFGPSQHPAKLLSKLNFPTRLFFPIDQPLSAFVCMHSQDTVRPTLRDLSSLVQLSPTILREARAAQPNLRFGPESCLCWAHIAAGASRGKGGSKDTGSRRPTDPRSTKAHRQDVAMPKRALIIKRKWAELILSGEKTWEVRGEPTTKRERIAIAQAGSKQLVGEVTLAECFLIGEQPSPGVWVSTGSPSQYIWAPDNANKHCIADQSSVNYKKAYAWVMEDARKYPAPRPYTHKPGCMKWVKLDGGSVAQFSGRGISLKGRPLWCDASDGSSDASTSPHARGDEALALPSFPNSSLTVPSTLTSTNDDNVEPVPISLATALGNGTADSDASYLPDFAVLESCRAAGKEWTATFLAFLSSQSRAASFFKALQSILSIEPSIFANTCAQLAMSLPGWTAFFLDSASRFADLPFEFIPLIHACLNCPPVLLWVLPSQTCLLLSDGTCALSDCGVLTFPCIAYNALNGFYFPLRVVHHPVFVPALSETAALDHLQLLLFGLAPLHLPATENIFYCFKSTRLECLHFLETLQTTLRMRLCRCLQRVAEHPCGCGLSQLCLVLSPAYLVDLIIIDSYSCLFHVSSFHSFQPLSWQAAIQKLRSPNCFLFVFVHSTGHFVQAMLHVPSSSTCPEVWLGQPQPTARMACAARIPINVADPPLTARLSRHAMQRFATCAGGASSSATHCPLPDELRRLIGGTPETFNEGFMRIYQKSPDRAHVVARYVLASMVPFPERTIETELPPLYQMTVTLAQKAGCPFEWAFLLFLPVLATACSKARLYINEFFLVPPLLWIGLCLDSGANKSGIMTAMADIISGFEKALLDKALSAAREEHAAEEYEEDIGDGNADGSKRRKTSLNKALAVIRQNKPALFSDEGSLPAIGLQMSQNGHRAIGMYDEGRFLLRALSNGEGSGFNASTMSKLFNGSVWKRTVVKDQNRFSMHQTCLCLAMTFHIEEWHDFLNKDGALGMQSRFLTFHSSPRLDKAADVLESSVYGTNAERVLALPESLLEKFVSVLKLTEEAHRVELADYDKDREYIPYFFASDALSFFTAHFDAQVLEQEMSYLQDPKKFSHAGKLKSLPWRLAILLHCWTYACKQMDDPATLWCRCLSQNVVQVSKTIFEYLSLQSQFLAPGSDLLQLLQQHGFLQRASQQYPSLITFLQHKSLSIACAPSSTAVAAVPAFQTWWSALSENDKIYALVCAQWLLHCTSTLLVDQNASLRKLHDKDAKDAVQKLAKEDARPHVHNCFALLQHAQVGIYLHKGTSHRFRKRAFPVEQSDCISFSNMMKLFKHKLASNSDQYKKQHLVVTESLKSTYSKDDIEMNDAEFSSSKCDAVLAALTTFCNEAKPFDHAAKILAKSKSDASQPDLNGGAASDHLSRLLYPASWDLLPVFVLANSFADARCYAQCAASMLPQAYPSICLDVVDCQFVLDKLRQHAPHLLGANLARPCSLPLRTVLPEASRCLSCSRKLQFLRDEVVPCVRNFEAPELVKLETHVCLHCSLTYSGPWKESVTSTASRRKFLVTCRRRPHIFFTTHSLVFAASFLDTITNIFVHCGGSFQGLARSLRFHFKSRHSEQLLRDNWLQYSVIKILKDSSLTVNFTVQPKKMEAWSRTVEPMVSQLFQLRWLHTHTCQSCSSGLLGVDGNAKLRTKLCESTDDGIWNCTPLNAHCLTGCQNSPIPGKRYCALHLRDADPLFGSDWIMLKVLRFLSPKGVQPTIRSSYVLPPLLTCRRLCKSLRFALVHAEAQYPVQLLRVQKIARSRRYSFRNRAGKEFALLSSCVPIRFQQQFGLAMLEPEARECQVKPRVGAQMDFTAAEQKRSCRTQWNNSTKARRSGGLLAAVKPCQIIAAMKLVYTHESPTGVYFFLAELLQSFADTHGVQLRHQSQKKRLAFLRQHMPLVWYDCACTLKRFITAKRRKHRNKAARTLSKLRLAIDKFHFRKGHSGCRPDGTSPLPCVWPKTHEPRFGVFNDSGAEQAFAFVKRIAVAARRMTPIRGLLFVMLVQHARNEMLERNIMEKENHRKQAHVTFRQKLSFEESAECHLFTRGNTSSNSCLT